MSGYDPQASWCFVHSVPLPCETCADARANPQKYAERDCAACHGAGKYEHWGFMIDGATRICPCVQKQINGFHY